MLVSFPMLYMLFSFDFASEAHVIILVAWA